MAFITLTDKYSGKPIYVNPNYIVAVQRNAEDNYTYVNMLGDAEYYFIVVESPQAIFDLITVLYERNN